MRVVGGKYIRRRRTDLGLTYAQVAEVMGVHEITCRNWEKEKTLRKLVRLAFDHAFPVKKRRTAVQKATKPHPWAAKKR
jgi:transcriptional regulator with XRE-family HTH domain